MYKGMKLDDLKKWMERLSDEELQLELNFHSDDYSIAGPVTLPIKATENYYHVEGESPAPLFTAEELRSDGYDDAEINAFNVVIPKGTYYFNLEINTLSVTDRTLPVSDEVSS